MNKSASPPVHDHRLELAELLDALVADGLVTAADARTLPPEPAAARQHPLQRIADARWRLPADPAQTLGMERLMSWLSERSGLPQVRIDPLSLDVARITQVLPYAYAARARLLPLKVSASEVVIATCEPWWHEWERELAPVLQREIRRVLASPAELDRYIVEFYALARSVKASNEERGRIAPGSVQNLEQLTELGRTGKLTADDQHIVAIVDWLLQYAFEQRASDIHLEPRRERGNIRFRIDGVLHEVYQVPPAVMPAVTSRLKILARLDVAEKRRPQDGRIKTRTPAGKEIELRVSSLPTAFGEKIVMRIFDPEVLVRDHARLGFSAEDLQRWQPMIRQPNGIILVTGPTGSGKTTTLYSTLRQLATPEVNVCSIEDPIELVEPSFNQMQVNPAIELDFAAGVRALLRQDPDIIMVGEIRDLETAENAVQAALTGHLVLSTLHTNDAPSAITRLLELGVAAYLIKATLIGVLAQRLVRRLCPHCKREVAPEADQWQELVAGWPLAMPERIHEPVGCLECRETGYLGRCGLYEIMPLSSALRSSIGHDTDLARLRIAAQRDGMTPLRIAGARQVIAGQTSIAEVLRCSPEPQD